MPELLEPAVPSLVKLHYQAMEQRRTYKDCLIDFCENRSRMSLSLTRNYALDLLRFGPKALPSLKKSVYATRLPDAVKSANANALEALAKLAKESEAQFRIGPSAVYQLTRDVVVPGFSGLLRIQRSVATLVFIYAWKTRLPDRFMRALSFGLRDSLANRPDFAGLDMDIYDLSAVESVRSPRIVTSSSLGDGREPFESAANELLQARHELILEGYKPSSKASRRGSGKGGDTLI